MRILAFRLAFPLLLFGGGAPLLRIVDHVRQEVAGIPNYTCVETIDRETQTANVNAFRRVDLVRLEVAKTGGKELFAWPGAGNFEEKPIGAFVGGGLIGDGSFSLFAEDLFVNG